MSPSVHLWIVLDIFYLFLNFWAAQLTEKKKITVSLSPNADTVTSQQGFCLEFACSAVLAFPHMNTNIILLAALMKLFPVIWALTILALGC